ncbi:MAG: hypothetical protein DMF88_25980 [Acidobacteria bacterium]|nr:MAG: hypothetical protein DMF88_25980 [Acidobacteriota bacterium]
MLIERTRTAVTDGQGQYRIIDLRPGMYFVTFSLTGFQTIKREDIDLPGEFTATVNAEMRIGAVAETVTVSGASPTVDVQSAAHIQSLDRDALDNIPTGRTIQSIGQIIVGINLSLPDVGGSRAAMQTYMSVHGQSAANNTVMVDGMTVNGLESNGQVQSYFNDADSQRGRQSFQRIVRLRTASGQAARRQPDAAAADGRAHRRQQHRVHFGFHRRRRRSHRQRQDLVLCHGPRLPHQQPHPEHVLRQRQTGRRLQLHPRRARPHHVASEHAQQVLRLLRPREQVSRARHAEQLRPGDRGERLDVAELFHRQRQVELAVHQSGDVRGRLCVQRRAAQCGLRARR